jgi:hypothetical protein
MTVNYQPNPLNTLGLRQLDFCPPHFFPVAFDLKGGPKKISDWVWEHLSGRFFYGEIYVVNEENSYKPILQKVVAFEVHSEASYFALMLNDINKF